ncbi:hypothetical protein KIN20_027989 [Parelaphostrongylus tenuis]|uniref:Uncharacterized protein n=1 Tax=Parelaphostrongylus tenuis TaxID=148309 RepID=A0AAD5R030_PARTN|nr:hypothetical protein KIN20_027989 [Parelaphostrongylus tenuis]
MAREPRDQRMERPKLSQKQAEDVRLQLTRVHMSGQKCERKTTLKASRLIHLINGASLLKVLCTDEKIFMAKPFHDPQNRRQLPKMGQQKLAVANHGPHSCSGLCDGLGQHLRHRKDPRWSSSTGTSTSALPAISSRFYGTCWSLRLLNTLAPMDSRFTRLLRQEHLSVKLVGSQPSGLRVVHNETKSCSLAKLA